MREMYRDPGLRTYYRHSVSDGEIESAQVISESSLTALRQSGTRRKPMRWLAEVSDRCVLVVANISGSILVKDGPMDRVGLLHSRSVLIAPGPLSLSGMMSRGDHEQLLFCIRDFEAQSLMTTWNRATTLDTNALGYGLHYCKPNSFEGEAFDLLAVWARTYIPTFYSRVLGTLLCLGGSASASSGGYSLASLESEAFPEPIKRLLEDVRESPRQPWSLKQAAAHAGYSPFHLSRAFKSSVGFGFPDFVEKCRIELAIPRVLHQTDSLDDVGMASGFSSAPAMRDAFRSNLGLLPSEFRTFAVEYETLMS